MGYPLLGTRETWVVPTVPLATVLPSHAPRPTPDRRGEVVRRTSPAGYCLQPTVELAKTKRDPIATSGPFLLVWHQIGRTLRTNQSVLPARRRPTVDHSLVAVGAQRQGLQTCRPDGRHKPESLSSACPICLPQSASPDYLNRVLSPVAGQSVQRSANGKALMTSSRFT